MKLFCFSIAGGSEIFSTLHFQKQVEIELVKLDYPGHGSRINEKLLTSIEDIAEDAYNHLRSYDTSEPYALFGYSMGCVVLIELVRAIEERAEIDLPKHIFLAANAPNSGKDCLADIESESDSDLKKRIIRFGGIPEDFIENRHFWNIYLPIYRADYKAMSLYCRRVKNISIFIPSDIFYCESDTPLSSVMNWKQYIKGNIEYHSFLGGHFFIKDNGKEIGDIIALRTGLPNKDLDGV